VFEIILDGQQKVLVSQPEVESETGYAQGVDTFYFSFVGPETPQGYIRYPLGLATCRESLVTMIESAVRKPAENRNIPIDRGRFLLRLRKDKKENIEKAMRVLHLLENTHGFPRTLCFRINTELNVESLAVEKIESFQKRLEFFYLVTSRKWIKSSYMVSLLFLILRTFYTGGCHVEEKHLKSIETFRERMESFRPRSCLMSYTFMVDTYRYWETILRNYNELFGKFSMEHNWNCEFNEMTKLENTMRYEGVLRLCAGTSLAKKVQKRWNKIKQQENERKKALS
jgi:hypothetical protein